MPVAFSPDGSVGIFESNSMLRAVARLGRERRNLYGDDPYTTSRIDSFLDVSLVFARDSQRYLLALGSQGIDEAIHAQAKEALETYLAGMEQALEPYHAFLVGKELTIADVCFATELALFSGERRSKALLEERGLSLLLGETRDSFPSRSDTTTGCAPRGLRARPRSVPGEAGLEADSRVGRRAASRRRA